MSQVKRPEGEEALFTVKSVEGERTYRVKEPGAQVVEKLLQLYTLGMIEAAELELIKVAYPNRERTKTHEKPGRKAN